jgi:hypothetical protein
LHGLAKLVVSMESELLELRVSITVLKLTAAALMGAEPTAALDDFREREMKVLESLPTSQKLREVRELIDFLEEHGKSFGEHKA